MTYKGKNVVSVSFGANVSGVADADKNIDVLFDDNSVMTVKYSNLVRQLAGFANQQALLTASVSDTTNLKALCVSTLGLTA